MVDDRHRRTDGCRFDGYTISSPCEPNASVELISSVLCLIATDQTKY